MTFDDYQTAAARTINRSLSPADRLLDAAAGLAEEAGEVLGIVRKQRTQNRSMDAARLREELGDALWCLTITARSAGLTLDEVAAANVEKLKARFPNGFSR
ncbi:MAG: MazG nucleotide pyrophosphohydrolase domain-containing protein [Gemmatimonadaceae bacterium]